MEFRFGIVMQLKCSKKPNSWSHENIKINWLVVIQGGYILFVVPWYMDSASCLLSSRCTLSGLWINDSHEAVTRLLEIKMSCELAFCLAYLLTYGLSWELVYLIASFCRKKSADLTMFANIKSSVLLLSMKSPLVSEFWPRRCRIHVYMD